MYEPLGLIVGQHGPPFQLGIDYEMVHRYDTTSTNTEDVATDPNTGRWAVTQDGGGAAYQPIVIFDKDGANQNISFEHTGVTWTATQFCMGVQFSPDGNYIYGLESWQTLGVRLWKWDSRTGALLWYRTLPGVAVTSHGPLEIDSLGNIYTVTNRGTIPVYSEGGVLIKTVTMAPYGYIGNVYDIYFSERTVIPGIVSGRLILCCQKGGFGTKHVYLYDLDTEIITSLALNTTALSAVILPGATAAQDLYFVITTNRLYKLDADLNILDYVAVTGLMHIWLDPDGLIGITANPGLVPTVYIYDYNLTLLETYLPNNDAFPSDLWDAGFGWARAEYLYLYYAAPVYHGQMFMVNDFCG